MKTQKKVQVWVVNRTPRGDRFLILKVIPKRGGGWHPITGSVEDDEVRKQDWLAAAKRETEEETGVDPGLGEWIDLEMSFEFEGRFGHAQEFVFGFVLHDFKDKVVLDPKEHEDLEWVDQDEALRRLGFDSQQRALKAFLCYLR